MGTTDGAMERRAEDGGGGGGPRWLARPDVDAAAPGILVVGDLGGFVGAVGPVAERLARGGRGVLAVDPDPLARARVDDEEQGADVLWAAERRLPDRDAVARLEAALDELARHPGVDGDRLAAVGFGTGATLAFLLGCKSSRVAAVVGFAGRIVYPELSAEKPVQPLELALNLGCPLLGSYGALDPVTPPEHVDRMRTVLSQFAREFDIVSYPGAGRRFHAEGHGEHDRAAAEDAWSRVEAFLTETLA